MDNNTRNQQRLAQYSVKRQQHLLNLQMLAWVAQAGSLAELQQRVSTVYKTGVAHV